MNGDFVMHDVALKNGGSEEQKQKTFSVVK